MIRVEDLPPDPGTVLCNEVTQPPVRGLDAMAAAGADYQWATWLPDILSTAGCKVDVVAGWERRGRPPATGAFHPIGILDHHTGTTTSDARPGPTLGILTTGRPDLPGPLCHITTRYDGLIVVVAAGRANHAGQAKAAGAMPPGDGNAIYLGNEIDYDGTQRMGPAQYDAVMLSNAAILKHLRVDERHLNRHADTSLTGKWDNGGYTTAAIRAATAAVNLGAGAADMPLTQDDAALVAKEVIKELAGWAPGSTNKVDMGDVVQRLGNTSIQQIADILAIVKTLQAAGATGITPPQVADELGRRLQQ